MENISDINFYLRFTKPLILSLDHINDRVLAAAWVKRLADEASGEEKIRLDYLKLLLFVLQRKKLAPPFTQHPNNVEVLESFPEEQTLVDVAKNILEKEQAERQEEMRKRLQGDMGDQPPYISDFSADLLEYVSVQTIENFGVHGYYAVSKEPLNTWYRVDKQLLPKAAKSMLEVSGPPPPLAESVSVPEVPTEAKPPEKPEQEPPPVEAPPPEPPLEPEPSPPKKKKESPRRSSLGATPPSRPIGKIFPPPEDREPPTWGSNLLEAKFLDEEEEAPGPTPTEVLWSSPPPGGPAYGISDESPFLVSGEDTDLETSMPSFLQSSIAEEMGTPPREAWTSAASIPYMTPPYPYVTPPPPGKPTPPPVTKKLVKKQKPPPKTRQTRASLLLQQKKAAELAPPPPPPEKKRVLRKPSIVKKPSKSEVVSEKGAEEEAPPKKGVKKVVSKGKVKGKGKKPVAKEVAVAQPQFASPGEPFKGFPADDVDAYVEEYSRLLEEMEADYNSQFSRPVHEQRKEVTAEEKRAQQPKRKISRLARYSKLAIPKSHAAPVELDKSIHISPEARQILEGVIEGPSTSTGITHPEESIMRHPRPILSHDAIEEEEEVETGDEIEDQGEPEIEYATAGSAGGHAGKDPRVVTAFNQMLNTSTQMEAADLEGLDLEGMEIDIANISGGNLDDVMAGLEAAAPQEQQEPDYEDFEAMERMVEDQMRREGQDPHAKPKRRLSKKSYARGSERYKQLQSKMYDQLEELEAAEMLTVLDTVAASPDEVGVIEAEASRLEEAPEEEEDAEEAAERRRIEALPLEEKMKELFPGMEAEGEELDLAEDLIPEGMVSPVKEKQCLDDLRTFHSEFIGTCPVYQSVAVTSPKPTAVPRRPRKSRIKVNIQYSPPLEHGEEEAVQMPTSPSQVVSTYPPFEAEYTTPERVVEPMKPVQPTEATGVSPPHKHWWSDLDELHHRLYGTTEQQYPTVFDVPTEKIYAESPPPKLASPVSPHLPPPIDPEQLRREIEKGKVPKDENFYLRELRPGKLLVQRFNEGPWFDLPFYLERRGRRGDRLFKHHDVMYKFSPVQEQEEPPTYLTQEELYFRDELAEHEPVIERRPMQMPYKHMRQLPTKSARSPELAPVRELYETPEKKVPDVFDIPDMHHKVWGESPPPEFASPISPRLSPRIDTWDLREEIQERAVPPLPEAEAKRRTRRGYAMGMRTHGKRPGLATLPENLDPEEFNQMERIWKATGKWPVLEFPKKKVPTLSPITSPIAYESPTTRYPVGESPGGRVGPLRRTLRKNLKKRRIDFSQPPPSPDEAEVEATEVHTTISEDIFGEGMPLVEGLPEFSPLRPGLIEGEMAYIQGGPAMTPDRVYKYSREELYTPEAALRELSPGLRHLAREVRDLTPSPQKIPIGSPRTPRTPKQEHLHGEEMPYVEDLPGYEPPSPMSQEGVLEGIVDEVKGYVHRGLKRPKNEQKLRDYYKKYFRKLLRKIPEEPLHEAAAVLHDQLEAQVEAEMAAKVAEEISRRTILDEPVPEDLPEAMTPAFYVTPPHLKKNVLPLKKLFFDFGGSEYYREMLLGQPQTRHVQPVQPVQPDEEEELDEFERLERSLEAEELRRYPPGYVPPSPKTRAPQQARRVQHLAEQQYDALKTPPKPPVTIYDVIAQTMAMVAAEAAEEAAAKAAAAAERKKKKKEEKEARLYRLMYGRKKEPPKAKEEPKEPEKPKGKAAPKAAGKPAAKTGGKPPAKTAGKPPEKAASKLPPKAAAKPAPKGKKVTEVKSDKSVASTKSDRSVATQKSSKSAKSAKSDKSVKEKKSDASVKSGKSDTSVAKPRRKKFNVVSKIDTGRKKKPEPKMQVGYDLAALKDLGLTAGDLQNLNLNDLGGNIVHLEAEPAAEVLPPHVSPQRPPSPIWEEDEEDYGPEIELQVEVHRPPSPPKLPSKFPPLSEMVEEYHESEVPQGAVPPLEEEVFQTDRAGSSAVAHSQVVAQEYYDPETEEMVKTIRITGSAGEMPLQDEAAAWPEPSVLQAVPVDGPLRREEQEAVMEAQSIAPW